MSDTIEAGNIVRVAVTFQPHSDTGTPTVIVLGNVSLTIEIDGQADITPGGITAGLVDADTNLVTTSGVTNSFYCDVEVPPTAVDGEWQPVWHCSSPEITRSDPAARFGVRAIT